MKTIIQRRLLFIFLEMGRSKISRRNVIVQALLIHAYQRSYPL